MIVYSSGCMGPEVERIQQNLKERGYYLGPIDGLFGGGTEAAVKLFQRERGLEVNGKVKAETWATLFAGEMITVPAIRKESLEKRCLALTGCFETGRMIPEAFCSISGNFDGQGIGFGALQWNLGQQSLQPLLKEINSLYSLALAEIFDAHFQTLSAVLYEYGFHDQMAWAISIQTDRFNINEPWKGFFKTVGRNQEYQNIQMRFANHNYQIALKLCREYKLSSERAVALMFDVVVQNGSIRTETRQLIETDFAKLDTSMSPENLEVERMRIVANRRAEACGPLYRNDVRSRKMCCADGMGSLHGTDYDLENQFGITLEKFC